MFRAEVQAPRELYRLCVEAYDGSDLHYCDAVVLADEPDRVYYSGPESEEVFDRMVDAVDYVLETGLPNTQGT